MEQLERRMIQYYAKRVDISGSCCAGKLKLLKTLQAGRQAGKSALLSLQGSPRLASKTIEPSYLPPQNAAKVASILAESFSNEKQINNDPKNMFALRASKIGVFISEKCMHLVDVQVVDREMKNINRQQLMDEGQ